jgi:hypothetical protein
MIFQKFEQCSLDYELAGDHTGSEKEAGCREDSQSGHGYQYPYWATDPDDARGHTEFERAFSFRAGKAY